MTTERVSDRPCVALVVPSFDRGGLEQIALNLYRQYLASGFRCVVMVESRTAGYYASLLATHDDVFIFDRNEELFLQEILSRDISYLHYHYSCFGLAEMSALGFGTCYTLHNVYTWLGDEEFRVRAEAIATADRVVAVSAAVRNYFCARSGFSTDRVEVVPNGVDFAELCGGPPISRQDLGLPKSKFLFANIASFHRTKHQALIIRAVELLLRRRQDFHVAMIGNVGDEGYFAEISDRLKRSPAAQAISILPPLPREQMQSLYKDLSNCVLLPSIQEGCSNVIQEACGLGVPVIATDVGHAAEAAKRFETVRLVARAFGDMASLDAAMIDRLSRETDPVNAEPLADAMGAEIDAAKGWTRRAVADRGGLGVAAMGEAYIRGIERWRSHQGLGPAGSSLARRGPTNASTTSGGPRRSTAKSGG